MKIIRWTALSVLMLLIVGILFRGCFYRQLITYKSVGLRDNYSARSIRLIDCINTRTNDQSDPDVEQIIKRSLLTTSKQLTFTVARNDVDPNKLVVSKKTHCVGYAFFFATTCNYLLDKHSLADTWVAKPQIGQVYFLGTNIHRYFHTYFWRDHDFVIIENKVTGQIFAVDPTVNDYLSIDFVTYVK